jgi:hypothetical protein
MGRRKIFLVSGSPTVRGELAGRDIENRQSIHRSALLVVRYFAEKNIMFLTMPLWKEKSIHDMSRLNNYKVVGYYKKNIDLKHMVEFYNYMIEKSGRNPMTIDSRLGTWKD